MADSIKKTTQERVKEITDSIESGIRELFNSDRYQSYLSTMSRFHSYSFNNTVLIHMQRPDATLVAGFKAWRDKFGRHVMRGEKGIQILAPTPVTKKIQQKVLDPETKAPVLDADGTPITEEKSVKLQYYKPVSVFDVSQTEGKPLPELAQSLTGDVAEYETFVEALRRSSPVPIEFEPMAESMDGYFSADKQRIAIRPSMSQVQTVSAMVHEIGHSMLHDYEKLRESASIENGAAPIKKDHRTEEVEAESVSYSVCQYYGIETGANSFGYIAAWSKDKKLKELKSSLETIKKTADSLIKEIDRNLAEIRRERGLEQEKETASPDHTDSLAAESVAVPIATSIADSSEQARVLNRQQNESMLPSGPPFGAYYAGGKIVLVGINLENASAFDYAIGQEHDITGLYGFTPISKIAEQYGKAGSLLEAAALDVCSVFSARNAAKFSAVDIDTAEFHAMEYPLPDKSFSLKDCIVSPPSNDFYIPVQQQTALKLQKQDFTIYSQYETQHGSRALIMALPQELHQSAQDTTFYISRYQWERSSSFWSDLHEQRNQLLPAGPEEALYQVHDALGNSSLYIHINRINEGFAYEVYDSTLTVQKDTGFISADVAFSFDLARNQMIGALYDVCFLHKLSCLDCDFSDCDLALLPKEPPVVLDQYPMPDDAVAQASDAVGKDGKTDPYLAYATAVFEHADELQRAGLIGPPVLPSKEEAANEYAGVLRSGGFSNAKEVLDDFARTSGYPTPERLYRQMESLAEQWNQELTYQIEANALSPRDSFVTSYHEGKRHETLFYGPTAVGERLLHDLESGRMTPDQARDLKIAWESAGQPFGENELLFGLDDGRAVHLRRTEHRINRFQTDRGYDYTVFNPDGEAVSHGLIRDGEARSYPAYTQIGGAFEAICEKLNADPAKAEAFPLEKLDQLLASNAMEAPARKPTPAALDEYPMPDAVLRTSDLQATGCTDPTLLPVTLDRATELFADGFTVYTISKDGYPLMVMDQEELDRLSESAPNAVCAIEQNEWEQSRPFHNALNLRHDRQAEREAAFLEYPGDAFAIYQVDVTKSAEFRRRAFLGIDELRQLGLEPDRSYYALAYTGSLAQHPNVSDPEAAYRVFNLERPTDFSGHSLSVSDIVAFKRNGVVTYHYCDSLGFAEVPEFLRPENYLKNAEMAMEDDYGMIDGIINNGPKDSGPPKAGPQKEDSHFSPRRLPSFLERGRREQEQQQAQREQRPRREERSL